MDEYIVEILITQSSVDKKVKRFYNNDVKLFFLKDAYDFALYLFETIIKFGLNDEYSDIYLDQLSSFNWKNQDLYCFFRNYKNVNTPYWNIKDMVYKKKYEINKDDYLHTLCELLTCIYRYNKYYEIELIITKQSYNTETKQYDKKILHNYYQKCSKTNVPNFWECCLS